MATPNKKPRKPREKAPANESRSQRFVRLAKQRVPRVLKGIQSIGKLSGASYEYTEDQAARIVNALESEVAALKERLAHVPPKVAEFSLD